MGYNHTLAQLGRDTEINILEVFQGALPGLSGGFDVYELTAGSLLLPENYTISVEHPVFYLTNLTESDMSNYYADIVRNVTEIAGTLDLQALDKEPFVGGIVSLCFALSGVVTASWMLFLLVLLSSNTIPNSLILANLFHAVWTNVMLSLLTNYLHVQVIMNFQDTQQLRNLFTCSTSYIILKALAFLFIHISWIDLMVQITRYEHRKRVLVVGLILSFLTFAFAVAFNFLYKDPNHKTAKFLSVKTIYYFLCLSFLLYFTISVVRFSFKKKRFAYHRKTIALAIFSYVTILAPYLFTITDIVSDVLRNWSTHVTLFSNLLLSVTVWEWLHSISELEHRYERVTILGRKLSNDSFTQTDIKKETPKSPYILKSLNITEILTYIGTRISSPFSKLFHVVSFGDDIDEGNPHIQHKNTIQSNEVRLYEMEPMVSRGSSSVQSQDQMSDNVSFVGEYPQFNVDHRYLRNTPSTTGPDTRRATPATPATFTDNNNNE